MNVLKWTWWGEEPFVVCPVLLRVVIFANCCKQASGGPKGIYQRSVNVRRGNRNYLERFLESQNVLFSKCSVSKLVKRTNELKYFFGLSLILFGFGNIVADFHVLFRARGNNN